MPLEGGTTAMTPEQIAARLPQLTHGPHHNQATMALAEITAEAIRILNHATRDPGAITEPATVHSALGQLAAAAHRLPQLCGQLAGWLAQEYNAGRLACAQGVLDDAVGDAQASLDRAARHATRLGEALDQAQKATAWLYRPAGSGEDR
jgi:hypothetical protein